MRVAYLVNRYPSISHSFIRREIAALARRGLAIERFTIRPPDTILPDPADQGEAALVRCVLNEGPLRLLASLVIIALCHPRRTLRALRSVGEMTPAEPGRWMRAIAYLAEGAWLAREVTKAGITHIHAHFGTNSTTVARLTAIYSGIPYSFTAHGPEEYDRVSELGIAAKARDARFVAVISSFGRSQMMRLLAPDQWDKIEVVRCGLVFEEGDGRPEVDTPAGPQYDFCFVGRFAPQKGLPTLVDALHEIARRGETVSLVMIGDGELFDWFAEFREAAGLEGSITLMGVQGEAAVNAAMRASTAVLVPSYAEGLPVVLMEAFANRRPVISTFVAGIPELVTRDAGILVPAGDAAALADAMLAMKSSTPETLARMGEAGYEAVRRRHDVAAEAALLHRKFAGKKIRGELDQ